MINSRMWFEKNNRILDQDCIDHVVVTTVLLEIDLWETMIFGGIHDGWRKLYTKREEALAGHQEAVELVRGSRKESDDKSL